MKTIVNVDLGGMIGLVEVYEVVRGDSLDAYIRKLEKGDTLLLKTETRKFLCKIEDTYKTGETYNINVVKSYLNPVLFSDIADYCMIIKEVTFNE